MAGQEIIVPEFDFSGMYYAEILEALLEYKRKNIPEISNENPFETGVQLLRAFALVGHLNNVLLDLVANETYLPTAQVRENVVRALALIGFTPRASIPATVDLRAQLTRGYSTRTLIVPDNALFGTRRRADTPAILFESDAAIYVDPTDVVGECWTQDDLGAWLEWTTEANGGGTTTFAASEGVALYLAHPSAFTDAIEFEGLSGDPGDDRTGTPVAIHVQYFDGEVEDGLPDLVTLLPAGIRFDLGDLLGDLPKVGAYAYATLKATGATERCAVQFDGTGNYIETTGFLGQSTVSTSVGSYAVGSYWHDVQIATDGTSAVASETETFANGDTITASFTATLARYPVEPDTIVSWSYQSGGSPKTATFNLDTGALGGDATVGTTVNASTGVATLVAASVPDAVAISVTYDRAAATLRQDGVITFLPPFNASDDWQLSALPEALTGSTGPTTEGYWLRVLISGLGAGTASAFDFTRVRWDSGGLYLRIPATQGQTVVESVGSGDGTPSQSFSLGDSAVIEGSVRLTVDGVEWTQVEDFFSSTDVDEHFVVTIDSDGVGTIVAGDGENGKAIPVGSNNVAAEYRVGATDDGNVGAGQVEVSRSGISRIKNPTNPLAATGWLPQEGVGELALEKLKRDGVASLRTLRRAVSPSDVEYLATRWTTGGAYPFSRARAVENGYGLQTIKLIVVPVGGGESSPTVRGLLEDYFNGTINDGGTEAGVLVANQRVTAVDFSPREIDVTITVTGGDEAAIRAALTAAIQPEATRASGDTSYRWSFGQTVTTSAISAIVFAADRDVQGTSITLPAADVALADDELPVLGTLTLTVV